MIDFLDQSSPSGKAGMLWHPRGILIPRTSLAFVVQMYYGSGRDHCDLDINVIGSWGGVIGLGSEVRNAVKENCNPLVVFPHF